MVIPSYWSPNYWVLIDILYAWKSYKECQIIFIDWVVVGWSPSHPTPHSPHPHSHTLTIEGVQVEKKEKYISDGKGNIQCHLSTGNNRQQIRKFFQVIYLRIKLTKLSETHDFLSKKTIVLNLEWKFYIKSVWKLPFLFLKTTPII
jgi:hypothetical protein